MAASAQVGTRKPARAAVAASARTVRRPARMSEAAPLRPNAAEIADARWLTVEEIGLMRPGLPSNQTVLEMLREVRL